MYMTPEQAFYGLSLLEKFKDTKPNKANHLSYKSIKKFTKLYR